jgi:galactokinase/mevalonate kinase-like predicted kinase
MTLRFLEEHLVMIPMEPRKPGCSVVEGKDITPAKVKALTEAAEACWQAILKKDLEAFAAAFKASFDAQTAMFPGMITPTYVGHPEQDNRYIAEAIAQYSVMEDVLAWKMPGAGGGGYLALVVKDAKAFMAQHPEAFELHIRRE